MGCENMSRVGNESPLQTEMAPNVELRLGLESGLSSFGVRKQFGLGFNHLGNPNRISGRFSRTFLIRIIFF